MKLLITILGIFIALIKYVIDKVTPDRGIDWTWGQINEKTKEIKTALRENDHIQAQKLYEELVSKYKLYKKIKLKNKR